MFYLYDRHCAENFMVISEKPIGEYSKQVEGDMLEFAADQQKRYGFDMKSIGNGQIELSN